MAPISSLFDGFQNSAMIFRQGFRSDSPLVFFHPLIRDFVVRLVCRADTNQTTVRAVRYPCVPKSPQKVPDSLHNPSIPTPSVEGVGIGRSWICTQKRREGQDLWRPNLYAATKNHAAAIPINTQKPTTRSGTARYVSCT
jgi:hypothetical protein